MIVDSAGCADFSFYRHDTSRTSLYGICYTWHRIRKTCGATLRGGGGRGIRRAPAGARERAGGVPDGDLKPALFPLSDWIEGQQTKEPVGIVLVRSPALGAEHRVDMSTSSRTHVFRWGGTAAGAWAGKAVKTLTPQILNRLSQLCEISTNSDQMLWTQIIQMFCSDWPRTNRKRPLFNTARPRPHVHRYF